MFRSVAAPSQRELHEHTVLTAYMAEYAEWDNRSHLERIRRYTYILARGVGMDHDEASLISSACMLHDIGKITLPLGMFQEGARPTPEDYKVAEQHTVEGCRLLTGLDSPLLQAAAVICLTHHERWDGSGYAEGLKGEAIPLSGRIMAIADVFDALTSKRHYKELVRPEAAFDLIRSSSGTLFDPAIVSVFFAKLDEIKSVLHLAEEDLRK